MNSFLILVLFVTCHNLLICNILQDADCLPENLSHPGVMGDAGVEKVDVMEYLNIKRAAPVGKQSGKGEVSP
jgi:hypothetical protein